MYVKRKRILHCLMLIFLFVLIVCVTQDFYSNKNMQNASRNTEEHCTEYGKSIQMELEAVEEEYARVCDKDSGEMSQFEMNEWACERFELWDNELNSLLTRCNDELDDETKEKLFQEEKQWSNERDANVFVAGLEWGKSSGQTSATYGLAEDMTYARVYTLAKYLAEARGETFQISKRVNENLKIRYLSCNEVFEKMRGCWSLDSNNKQKIIIAPANEYTENLDYESQWLVSDSQGYVISDTDVYGYSYSDIVFEVSRGGDKIFYWFSYNYDGLSIRICQANSLEGLYEAEAQLYEK